MNTPYKQSIHVCEVGLRDGLQSITAIMPTTTKIAWIHALAKAGLNEIEVASFVPPKVLPQMADAELVVQAARQQTQVTVTALVPNQKGAERAVRAGAHKITLPVSASPAHSMANVNRSPQEMVGEVQRVVAWVSLWNQQNTRQSVEVEVGISTAFGCSIQGPVPESDVMHLAEQLAHVGVKSIGLSDTTGMANPAQVRRMFGELKKTVGALAGTAHMHNTRGLGLANCLAALDAGVTSLDSSLGGIGGCPYAPGASGNVVSEDLVFMLETMGFSTGINLSALIECRKIVQNALPNEPLYGMVANAGAAAWMFNTQ